MGPLPSYPTPEHRADLFVVSGEQHWQATPERAAMWLTIAPRSLYTGILIVGTIGSGPAGAGADPTL
jgi:hypothetical protein